MRVGVGRCDPGDEASERARRGGRSAAPLRQSQCTMSECSQLSERQTGLPCSAPADLSLCLAAVPAGPWLQAASPPSSRPRLRRRPPSARPPRLPAWLRSSSSTARYVSEEARARVEGRGVASLGGRRESAPAETRSPAAPRSDAVELVAYSGLTRTRLCSRLPCPPPPARVQLVPLDPPPTPHDPRLPQLPKGAAPKKNVGMSPLARYKARYFDGENASGAPFLHVIGGLFLVGYTIDCESPAALLSLRLLAVVVRTGIVWAAPSLATH